MKSHSVAIFSLIFLLNNCKDANNQTTANVAINKKSIKVINQQDVKMQQLQTKHSPKKNEHVQFQKILDLSVPFKLSKGSLLNYGSKPLKQNYLPDLFNGQKANKYKSIQIVGKMIKRDKQLSRGNTIVDGAGFDINLAH